MKALAAYTNRFTREVAWDTEAHACAKHIRAPHGRAAREHGCGWWNTFLLCARSNDGGTVIAYTWQDFVNQLHWRGWLTSETRHWAHWGGIYDHVLATENLLPEWKVSRGAYNPGMGLWSCDLIKRSSFQVVGQRTRGTKWVMRDSARLMPDSLARVGKAFGLEKLDDVDRTNLGAVSLERSTTYCLRDCDVLLLAIEKMRDVWTEFGGELRDTLAGTSAAYIRHRVLPPDAWDWDDATDLQVSPSYYGGRVEMFERSLPRGDSFDLNSSYPAAMCRPLPTRLLRCRLGAPSKHAPAAIIRADVEVPEQHIGPLPYRPEHGALKGRLCFPTGKWRGMFTAEELAAAEELGCVKVTPIESWEYDAEPYFESFVRHWHAIKQTTTDPALRYIAKIAMNSLSGKSIERRDHEEITMSQAKVERAMAIEADWTKAHPNERPRKRIQRHHVRVRRDGVFANLFALTTEHPGALRHAPAAAYITSRGRVELLRGMHAMCASPVTGGYWLEHRESLTRGVVGYCDTDGIKGTGALLSGKGLGEWQHEHSFARAEFLGAKVYAEFGAFNVRGPDGNEHTLPQIVKAKGFHLPRWERGLSAESYSARLHEAWETLRAHEPLVYENTRGFKTGLAMGDVRLTRVQSERTFHGGIDKRCWTGSSSRPWNTTELETLPTAKPHPERR